MRFFELKDGRVKDIEQIRTAYFIVFGSNYSDRALEYQWKNRGENGIKREITDLNEWEDFVLTDKFGAMRLYRELTDCGLKEAKEVVDAKQRELKEKRGDNLRYA